MTTLTLDLQALETGNNSFMKITRSLCLSVCSTLAKPPQKSIPAPPHQCLAHRLGLLRSFTDPLGPWDRQSSCRAPRRAHEDIPSKQRLPSEVCPLYAVPMFLPVFSRAQRGLPDRAASAKCHSGFLPAEGGRAAGRWRLLSNITWRFGAGTPPREDRQGMLSQPRGRRLWLCSAPSVNPEN